MLGELIAESKGKRTGRRVLPTDGPGFSVEVSFEDSGKLLGIDHNEIGTYVSSLRPDGTLYGEGQGVIITAEGDTLSWKGAGVGKILASGLISYRGAVYFQTASPKFTRLNSVACVFEYEADTAGNTTSKLWEWK